MLRKIIFPILFLLVTSICIVIVFLFFLSQRDLPKGQEGKKAEILTQKIERAIHLDNWKKTAAVSFLFMRKTFHFRDNKRGYREVSWKKGREFYRVQYDIKENYLVYVDEKLLPKENSYRFYKVAYEKHTNDFFWLNPFSQMRAPGTKRLYVEERALLLQFTSGGVTPGDSYLIITDQQGLPIRWQMWVSIVPVKGIEFSFENWRRTKTGAHLSSLHRSFAFDLAVSKIETYGQYPDVKVRKGEDRFADFIKKRAK